MFLMFDGIAEIDACANFMAHKPIPEHKHMLTNRGSCAKTRKYMGYTENSRVHFTAFILQTVSQIFHHSSEQTLSLTTTY